MGDSAEKGLKIGEHVFLHLCTSRNKVVLKQLLPVPGKMRPCSKAGKTVSASGFLFLSFLIAFCIRKKWMGNGEKQGTQYEYWNNPADKPLLSLRVEYPEGDGPKNPFFRPVLSWIFLLLSV